MKRNLKYYFLAVVLMLLHVEGTAQLVQKSYTTSQGGGASTGTGLQQFGVAGESASGTASGGNYQMNVGFIYTISRGELPEPPSAPSDFLVLPLSETSLQITWVDNADNETGYSLERATSSDFSSDIVQILLGANTYEYTDDVSLTADTYYYYRIKAVSGGQGSDYVYNGTATFSGTLADKWHWASVLQGSSYGRTVANDGSGNTYVGGFVEENVTIGVENWAVSGGADGFVVKYNTNGSIQWGRQLASTGSSSVEEVKVDANGVLYVSGYFSGQLTIPNGPTFNAQGQTDGFLLKMDGNGQIIWARRLGGSLNDFITSHGFDGSGNIHLLYSSASINGTFGSNPLSTGLHLVTVSPNGSFVRTKTVSANAGVSGNDLAVDEQGNVYVVGGFNGSRTIAAAALSSVGGTDIYYAKFNNVGDPLWVKQASTSESDNAYAVAVNGSNVYVGGFFDGASLSVPMGSAASNGGREGFLLAANTANGSTQWVRAMGGAGNDGVLAMATSNSGQVVVGGFMGIDEMTFPPSGNTLKNGFGFFAQYDASGDALRVDKIEGKSNNVVSNRALSVFENNLFSTGRFVGAAKFGQLATLQAGEGTSMFVGKYKYQDICDTPVSFLVSNVDETSAEASWSSGEYPTGDALSYTIRYKPLGTIPWTEVITTSTSQTIDGLESGVEYLVQVSMTCTGSDVLNSAYTAGASFTTLGTPTCEVPVIAGAVNVSNTQQDITWNNTEAVTYDLRYRLKGTPIWTTTTGIATASTSLTGLEAGMTYQVQIRGVCSEIQTLYSELYEFTTSGATACQSPESMAVIDVTMSAATVTWADQAAESYEVRYKPNGSAIWTTATTATAGIDLTDLEPGTTYLYMVKAVCNSGAGLTSLFTTTHQFTTLGAPSCEVPVGLSASVATNSSTLTWTISTGAVAYDIRYRVQGTTAWTYIQSVANSKELSGLSAGTPYQLQIRSLCTIDGSFVSLYSNTFSFVTSGASECTTPTALQATSGTTNATLTWADQSGATGYQVRYRLEGTTAWIYETTDANSLSVSLLESGMPYMWTVRSICDPEGTLASPYASTAFFETEGTVACPVPTNLLATGASDHSVNLSWSNVGASSYQLRYRIFGTAVWTITSATDPTFFSLNGLESGMPYQVQVKAICEVDGSIQSLFSELVSFETSGTVSCEIPVGLAASNISTSSATLSWTNVPEAESGYELRYRVKGTSIWTLTTVGTNSFELTGLEPGMPYQFSVKSNCSAAPVLTSVYSVPIEFTTEGLPSCEVPSGFSFDADDTNAEITWTNLGSMGYDVRLRVSGATIWSNLNVATNSVNLASLESGTDYQFQVRSVCSADGSIKSLFSDVEFFSTTGTISCETPDDLVASSITNTGAKVSWSAAEGADQYDIRYRVKGTTIWSQTLSTTPSVVLSGLARGMPHQARVRTLCSSDNSLVSPYSTIIEFSTTGSAACEIPSGLVAGGTEQTTANLSWAGANGALSYEVLYRKQGDIIWTASTTSTASISLSGLTSLTTYQWKVRTICAVDNSLQSQFSSLSAFQTVAGSAGRVSEEDDAELAMGLDEVLASFDLVIYPNPSPDEVFFRITPPERDSFRLSVFNLAGQEVRQLFDGVLEVDEQVEFQWDATREPSGIYVFRLSSGRGVEISRKIVLTH